MLKFVKNIATLKEVGLSDIQQITIPNEIFEEFTKPISPGGGEIITIGDNGTSLTLQKGTYTATGANWGGEIPSYTFDTDTKFSRSNNQYRLQINNEINNQIENSQIESHELYQFSGAYQTDTIQGSQYSDEHYLGYKTSPITGNNVFNYDIKFKPTNPVYSNPTNIQYIYKDTANGNTRALIFKLNIMKDNNVIETVLNKAETFTRYGATFYIPTVFLRKLNEGEWLRLSMDVSLTNVSFGMQREAISINAYNFSYNTFASEPIKLGIESYSMEDNQVYMLGQDYENIWNLGTITMSNTSSEIVKYNPPI